MSLAVTSNATVYYVSNSGSDSNLGTSPEQAWRSLNKVNSFVPSPGDQILFNRGDEWVGTITVNASGTSSSPIVYGAYGSGEKPKIYGSEAISGWTHHSGNIYKASFNSAINQLFVDDVRMKVARHPNNGYLFINSVQNSNQFTCNSLDGGINYSGATWIGRTAVYYTVTKTVTSSSSTTLTLDSGPAGLLGVNEGFFLNNKLDFLDQAGEWYYSSSSKAVYLWVPNGDSPNNYVVRGSNKSNGIYAVGKDYITIQNIHILQQSEKGMFVQGCDYLTIKDNNISDPDAYGLYDSSNSRYNTITNNVITGANHYGVNAVMSYSTFSDNQVLNSGLFDNLGISGNGGYSLGGAVLFAGNYGNNTISYNRIINSGYNGIYFARSNNIIEYNFINNVCLTKGDGGGIYTSYASNPGPHGSVVRHNIVLNSTGSRYGTTASRAFGEGIYIDERAEEVTVENNTVAYCSNACIFLHDNAGSVVKNNTLMHGRYGVLISKEHGSNSVQGNIIYSFDEDDYEPNEILINKNTSNTTYDNNTYVHRSKSTKLFKSGAYYYDLNGWRTITGQDANSTLELSPLATGETEELFYNDTKQVKTINLGTSVYRDIYGNQVTGSFTLQPFTSKILIKKTSGSSNNSPVINDQIINVNGEIQVNEFVGLVTASDPDAGQILSYAIIQGNEENLFYINSSTGEFFANTAINETNDKTVDLVVEVIDNAADPLTASAVVTINISGTGGTSTPDQTAPTISSFTLPSTATSLTVAVSSFVASDDQAVAGYLLTETPDVPLSGDAGWTITAPPSYTFLQEGEKTLYAWAKDAAGNISKSQRASVIITLPDMSPTYSEYLFEEVSGTTVIDSKGSNDGTIVNEEIRLAGVRGEGLQFTGSGYINLGQSFGENVQTEVTLSAWIKTSSVSDDYQGIIMHGGPIDDSFALYIKQNIGRIAFKTTGTSAEWFTVDNVVQLWDGNWHQLVVTYDGSEKKIYLDSEVIATIAATGNIESGAGYNLLIGAGRDWAEPILLYEGLIDEVRIYNYALTSSEISDLYNLVNSTPETVYTTENIEICEGESYEGWTESGEYQRTLTASSGADSVVTTNLIVHPVLYTSEEITIYEGESYNGWTESGQYERILTASTGCDSIVTTSLTVLQTIHTTENVEICEGESYEGWTSAGQYQRTLISSAGGDSIVTTDLYVNPVYNITEDITINEGESYNGWTSAGTYERILVSSFGCDSTVTTILSVNKSVSSVEEVSICEGEDYLGWTKSGEYERILKSASDADSIVTTYLTVYPVYNITENVTINEGESYNGWTTTGVYERTLSTVYGCDSIVTINLQVEPVISYYFHTVWEGENGFNHMSINVIDASLYGVPLEAGDEIAVFDGEKCVGVAMLDASIDPDNGSTYVQINVSQDDGSGNGFVDGNSIMFRVWDESEQTEIEVNKVVYKSDYSEWETSGIFVSDGTSVVELGVAQDSRQYIQLKRGWNIFSSNLIPEDPGMDMIQQALVESGKLVKVSDELGNTYERWNAKVGWINNIGNLEKTEGYKIRVKSDCVLEIAGSQVSLPLNIDLKRGWNIISFPSVNEVDAIDILQPLIDAGILLKVQDEKGNSVEFWDLQNQWLNGIGNFKPGEGYLVEVSENGILSVTNDYLKSGILVLETPATEYFIPAFEGNGFNHMNINITNLDKTELKVGDEIAAYDGDICVGAVKLTQFHFAENAVNINASLADNDMDNGFIEGNSIELAVWNSQSDSESQISATALKGNLDYQKRASVFVELGSLIEDEQGMGEFDIQMYPNPASDKVNIRFSGAPAPGSQIILMDINGKQMQTREIQSSVETFDIQSYPAGIYLVKTVVEGRYQVKKLLKN